MKEFDVVIIGGGVLGTSAFYHLAKAGIVTCLVEQNTIGSGITSYSGGISRMFHLDQNQRSKAAFSLDYYRHFDSKVGVPVKFTEQGFMYFPAKRNIEASKMTVSDNDYGFTLKWLEPANLLAKFPFIESEGLNGAIWEPHAGYLDPVDVSKAWALGGQRHGGTILSGCRVSKPLYRTDSSIGLKTNLCDIQAKKIIISAGITSSKLLAMFGVEIPLYNKTIQVDLYQAQEVSPQMPCFIDAEYNLNGRGGEHYILLGTTCPDGSDYEEASAEHQAYLQRAALKRFKWSHNCSLVGSFCSLDTYSDRENGYAGYVDSKHQILLLSGFNGTAFKFAPYMGQHIQQLILEDSGVR
jgi:sarcosine oxidase subunit beta